MRVLVFGDSITQGFWDSEGGWVSRIRKHYDQLKINGSDNDPPVLFNLGISADSSDDVLARIESETKARAREDIAFVIAIGVNDARTKAGVNFSDPERFHNNLAEVLKIAKNYSSRILFIGLTPCDEPRSNPVAWGDTGYTNNRIKAFDDVLREFCVEQVVPFVDVFDIVKAKTNQTQLLPDSLHPNDEGHQLIADLVLPKLQDLLR